MNYSQGGSGWCREGDPEGWCSPGYFVRVNEEVKMWCACSTMVSKPSLKT